MNITKENDVLKKIINDWCSYIASEFRNKNVTKSKTEKYLGYDGYDQQEINGIKCWKFIPTSPSSFLKALIFVKEYLGKTKKFKFNEHGFTKNRINFLECGSGAGFNLNIAYKLGMNVLGLEYDEKLIKLSKKLFDSMNNKKMDITKFKHYDEYDIIFYYMPIVGGTNYKTDTDELEVFDEQVINKMKKGAILMSKDHFIKNSKLKRLQTDNTKGLDNYNHDICGISLYVKI